ncbi:hypothetical protein Rcae01_01804 [Novipirellula caenicola]|uniref:Uncharacterized protein n=1 Tax=Novipirellula caenicola TaxID=1536901 RepID=A0ABP9VMD1_9BACT
MEKSALPPGQARGKRRHARCITLRRRTATKWRHAVAMGVSRWGTCVRGDLLQVKGLSPEGLAIDLQRDVVNAWVKGIRRGGVS